MNNTPFSRFGVLKRNGFFTLFGSKMIVLYKAQFLRIWSPGVVDVEMHLHLKTSVNTAGNQLHLQIIYPAVPIWMDTEIAGVYPMAKLRIICVTQTGSPSTEFSLGKEVLIPSILAMLMLEYYHWDFMKNPRQGCRNADAIGATGHSLKFILILLIFWSFISHCKSFYYLDFPLVSLVKSLNRLNYSYLIGLS